MAAPVEAVSYAIRIVNNTPRLLRGALPGAVNGVALEVPPRSALDTIDVSPETARHLLARGATATRRGASLVFEVVVNATP
jgi:hypothetical protein